MLAMHNLWLGLGVRVRVRVSSFNALHVAFTLARDTAWASHVALAAVHKAHQERYSGSHSRGSAAITDIRPLYEPPLARARPRPPIRVELPRPRPLGSVG